MRRTVLALALTILCGCGSSDPAPVVYPLAEDDQARMRGYFPNVVLTSHEGEKVRFYDDLVRDKTVLINFMYTSCTGI